jgi:hypothetical protein
MLLASGAKVHGQEAVPRAMRGDSLMMTDLEFKRSFQGIRLTPANERVSRRLITHAFLKAEALHGQESFEQAVNIYERLDAMLLAMLRTRGDSALYLRNTESVRPPRSWKKKTKA